MVRLNTDIIGEFIRVLLLIIAIAAPLFGLWPAIGGITGVYALPAESTKVHKDTGVTTAPWTTETSPSISWIQVTVTATREVDVRIIALNNREIQVHNASGFAVEEDRTVVAGGGANNGQGIGQAVTLSGSHGGPGRYMIIVTASDDTRAANFTDRDIEYTLEWKVHKLDPTVFLMGLIVFSMVFVTEYILIMRRDVRAMARKLDKFVTEGGGPARAPSAALGVAAPSFGPPPAAAVEAPGRDEGARRDFFGGRSSVASAQAPAYDEQPAEEAYPAPPAIAMEPERPRAPPIPRQPTPYGAPTGRYGAPAPQQPAYGEPESFVPSAPPPPMPSMRAPAPQQRMAPAAPQPPVAPPAQQGPEPVTKVRCPQCKHIVPVFTAERPTPIKCPNCGKRGMLPR